MKGYPRTEQIPVSEEEMQRLYFDGRAIRRYCLQCRGPKFMLPAKKIQAYEPGLVETKPPDRYQIVCKNCGVKYTARLALEAT